MSWLATRWRSKVARMGEHGPNGPERSSGDLATSHDRREYPAWLRVLVLLAALLAAIMGKHGPNGAERSSGDLATSHDRRGHPAWLRVLVLLAALLAAIVALGRAHSAPTSQPFLS